MAKKIVKAIGERLQLPSEVELPIEFQGVLTSFNGYDILQTADYTKLSAESYLCCVLKGHGWETPGSKESQPGAKPKSPLNDTKVKVLYLAATSPKEGTREHHKLATNMGFGYRNALGYHNVLGELLYAYVLCHLDIAYSITTLAKFSIAYITQ